MRLRSTCLVMAVAGCGPQVPVDMTAGGGGTSDATDGGASATVATTADDDDGEDDDVDDDGPHFDDGFAGDLPAWSCGNSVGDPCPLDILVVVDNSSDMADSQVALTRALVQLVGRLEARDGTTSVAVDVQMMFTTSDMGTPFCEPFAHLDHPPARGAPTTTGCNARINDFTGLGGDPEEREDACTSVCPVDVAPTDPFVAFGGGTSNVAEVPPADVDGDGVPDSSAAQAVACLAPQGIDGCGFEQPLEAMLQAFDPAASWNTGDRPFLRPGSIVMVVLATTEMDCSMDDPAWMMDTSYMENHGDHPEVSSAMCWNAGMVCGPPDADGVYHDCTTADAPLQPTSRYANFLKSDLADHQVQMIALTAVPRVTALDPSPPFEPIAGGIDDLVLRQWHDGAYPAGDLVPQDIDEGLDAEDKTFQYKAGPGCTEPVPASDRFVQAIPNPRVNEVCASLDIEQEGSPQARCCIESICDPAPGLRCIDGWLAPVIPLPPSG